MRHFTEFEPEHYISVKKSTQALLDKLIEHHDYNIAFVEIEPEPKPVVEPEPEVTVPDVAPENLLSEYEIESEEIQIITIQKVVAHHFNMTRDDIMSNRHFARIVMPRQVAMMLSRRLTSKSLPHIARAFRKADHSVVYHAISKISGLMSVDPILKAKVDLIEESLKARVVA